jgi:hypothetical protein
MQSQPLTWHWQTLLLLQKVPAVHWRWQVPPQESLCGPAAGTTLDSIN